MSDPNRQNPATNPAGNDSDDLEEAYSAEYLADVAGGDARGERLDELKRRIEAGAYRIDADWVAQELLSRGDLDND